MIPPSHEYHRAGHRQPKKLLKGLDARLYAVQGLFARRKRVFEQLRIDAEKVDQLARQFTDVTDHRLREQLVEYRERFRRRDRALSDHLFPALAALRETAARQLGLRPFPVQLMGSLALHRGLLAEMATGEGKTLTAGLAAVLAGWTRFPCHIITVNDYLVQRDAEWLKGLYQFAGVRVGYVTGTMPPDERRAAYQCDVTYTTSKEVVADFLRDRLQLGAVRDPARRLIRQMVMPDATRHGLVMRGLHTCIVDEADSVLIDEAVTPLIISTQRKNETLREVIRTAQQIAEPFEPHLDYRINQRNREVEFTPRGQDKLDQRCSSLRGLWQGRSRRSELIQQALVAREFYRFGKQYVIAGGKIVIVDEFTGRPLPHRTWRQGMHQAVEAKEGIEITDPAETIARISFQRYFRLYPHLSGMTGTAAEAAAEFWQIYGLPVVSIPSHRPCLRQQLPDRIFACEESKWEAIVREVRRVHESGRPVLIGTRSVAASEKLAARLEQERLSFRLLNAVRHLEEAQIIAEAGGPRQITIATNMAGRGTDIRLERGVAELGGLHVIATERHESRRIDRQLFGRSARQGDPGSAQAFLSGEDELLLRYLPKVAVDRLSAMLKCGLPGSTLVARAAIALAQQNAQREAFRRRRSVLSMDEWLDNALSFAGPDAY